MGWTIQMTQQIEIILSITAFIFALWYTYNGLMIQFGLSQGYKRQAQLPRVSVLIAARNEEVNLPGCLKSLAKIEYPQNLLQVLVLNDRSVDNTAAIARQFASEISFIHAVEILEEKHGLKGKMNVLAQGIRQSQGEIILITDADCTVPRKWITEFVSYFTSSVAMVGGLTVLKGATLLGNIQCLDWIFLQGIASATAGLGKPVSILGNNFAFRRDVYNQVGGFERIGFSLTEDLALMRTISKTTNYQIAYPLSIGHRIFSKPEKNLKGVYQQRLRWIAEKRGVSLWGHALMGSAFLCKFALFLCAVTLSFNFYSGWALILMLFTETSILLRLLFRIKQLVWSLFWPFFELYYFAYSLIFGLLYWVPQRVQWKSRKYETGI
jgi:cellulose synthase/poly-beta-1,6-N-acetylglucosamine synthase-like glycosyltransferase